MKSRIIHSTETSQTRSLRFELQSTQLTEVGKTVGRYSTAYGTDAYNIDRSVVKQAFRYLEKNPGGLFRAAYRIGESLIHIHANTYLDNGVISIGCQTFTKSGTKTLREWAFKSR